MAEEFVLAFHDLQKDGKNNEKLVDFVRGHYANNLNAPEFYSALHHDQPQNDTHNFIRDLSFLYTDHFLMEEKLKSMDESLGKQLCYIDVCKMASAVFFIAAAMICAAAAATAAADANPKTKRTAAKAAAAAAAASILFGAVGRWMHSFLSKHEAAVKKQKEITKPMIMGARFGMKDLSNISIVAQRLQFQIKYKKEAAIKKSYEELLWHVEIYSEDMKSTKQLVLQSIMQYLD